MDRKRYPELGALAAVICILLDQICKFVMLEVYDFDNIRPNIHVTDFFNLVMVWNRGISFGMFQGFEYSNYFFMALAFTIILVLFILIKRSDSRYECIAYGMIIGGACGNLIDRIRIGAVADFFDFHLQDHHWPSFNIADSCVFLGAVLLISVALFKKETK
jgi:signal peptidase II